MSDRLHRLSSVAALALAQWWVLHWYGSRVRWGGSDGYEWVAFVCLVSVALVGLLGGAPHGSARRGWATAAGCAWVFACAFPFLGDLGRGLMGATGLAATASVALMGRGVAAPGPHPGVAQPTGGPPCSSSTWATP